MDLGLNGAGVLITGGSRGIGAAIALAFAGEGAKVAICARDPGPLEATAAKIRARGAECLAIASDLLDPDGCRDVVDRTAAAFGRLDVLVNNASPSVDAAAPKSIEEATDAQVLVRISGKLMVAVRCSRAAIPHMRRAGGGRIVCIGGSAARAVFRGELPGAGSGVQQGLGNAAIANFAKYLAEEGAPDGIVVNVVHPYLTRTDRHPARMAALAKQLGVSEAEASARYAASIPIGRVLEPEDIAPLVLLLASPLASAITGQAIAVDGGALRSVEY